MALKEGDKVPDFTLPASGGREVSLASLKGKPFVLYFYPKADTPGCTKEAQGFQEKLSEFQKLGVAVIGVSRDPLRAIDKFAEKYGITFPLASDEAGTLSEAFGTWVEKSMYGKKYMGMERSTFLIDGTGRIARAWHKVKVTGHVAEVLAAAKALAG
jgi:peroxiredoxin Q/BCP